jgi:superfamily II DNA or RNA helicase
MLPGDETDREILELEKEIKALEAKRKDIFDRIERLRHRPRVQTITESSALSPPPQPLTSASPLQEKIVLFRSLFKGREDLYARRWESAKTGKSGYQPVCKNEWIRGVCRKPEVKCGGCHARELVPLNERAMHLHLFGLDPVGSKGRVTGKEVVIGIYPLLQDETCWFLAVDFDKTSWTSDVTAFREICLRFGVPLAVERSRSGNGAHAWIFFAEPLPATVARRLGSFLLTETLDLRPEVGLGSFDRLFPNQDNMPKGGFGNLIALPLQHKAMERGSSIFLGRDLLPIPDQWGFLSSIPKMSKDTVEHIVKEASRRGKIIGIRLPMSEDEDEEPWRTLPSRRKRDMDIQGPFPKEVKIVFGNAIYIEKTNLPPALQSRLIRLASFQNPEFYKAQALRLSTYGKPRIISCAEDFVRHISLPRGCLEDTVGLFKSLNIGVVLSDERSAGVSYQWNFRGDLRAEQEQAFKALLAFDTGVLAAATAFGKTVIAAKMIAARGVNTLVLVHRRQILDQWTAQLKEFLGLKPGDIGVIGSGKHQPGNRVDIALIQSLCRKGIVDDVVEGYGQLIVDECHHIPAASFEQVARRSKARYILGLSATVARKDGHHPIIFMQCGPVRFRVGAKQGTRAHPFDHKVILRPTKFTLPKSAVERYAIQEIYNLLLNDEKRNKVIFEDIMQCIAKEKRSPVLITERRNHLEMFAERFRPLVKNVIVFKGGTGHKQRQALNDQLTRIKDEEERLLIATGKYLGEGFDDARLDTLFLTLPISWKGTLAQYAGRLHRLHYNKREVRIYDYVDLRVPMLERMFKRRLQGYRALGYEVAGFSENEPEFI